MEGIVACFGIRERCYHHLPETSQRLHPLRQSSGAAQAPLGRHAHPAASSAWLWAPTTPQVVYWCTTAAHPMPPDAGSVPFTAVYHISLACQARTTLRSALRANHGACAAAEGQTLESAPVRLAISPTASEEGAHSPVEKLGASSDSSDLSSGDADIESLADGGSPRSSGVASVPLDMPRRSLQLTFTCNKCREYPLCPL